MNTKAGLFKEYLAARGLTDAFEVEELADELHSVVFRGKLEIDGQDLPALVIIDDSMYSLIRVRVAANALKKGRELALLNKINDVNKRFKVFKYYVAEDNSLLLDCCIVSSGINLDCDAIYNVIEVILTHLADDYSDIMKIIWG